MSRACVVDERYRFTGFFGCPGHCRVRIFQADGLPPVILVSECHDNEGTSITNCAETLYPRLIADYLPGWLDQADELTIIEHYPAMEGARGRMGQHTYDLVTFSSWRPTIRMQHGMQTVTFGEPDWRHLPIEQVRELIGREV